MIVGHVGQGNEGQIEYDQAYQYQQLLSIQNIKTANICPYVLPAVLRTDAPFGNS
jgi:hypothetical protein